MLIPKTKRTFFEKITGAIRIQDDTESKEIEIPDTKKELLDREESDGQLTVDVYQTYSDIAGVKPEDLDISITRDIVTIKGKRETERNITEEDYFQRELYWGGFSRTILLPQEIEVDEAEAVEKHGLLILKLPKIDKNRQTKLRVKNNNN